MKKCLRSRIESQLEKFGYSDDYITQSCAEHILENESAIAQIEVAIEDEDMSFRDAINEAMEKAEDERLRANEYTVRDLMYSYDVC